MSRISVDLTKDGATALNEVSLRTGATTSYAVNWAVEVLAALVEQAEREGVTTISLPWDDRDLHLKVSRRPFPRWRPW